MAVHPFYLVPAYLPEVRSAKPTLMGSEFHYILRPGAPPWLWYSAFPGGPRISYNFDSDGWIHNP